MASTTSEPHTEDDDAMTIHPRRRSLALILLAGGLAMACSDSTAPSRAQSDLNILQLLPTAPPLVQNSVSFQACQGQGAEGRLFFQSNGGGEGDEFARLTFDGNSLSAKPDGTPFTAGECITITMSLADPQSRDLLVQLEPSGLRFDANHPVQLRLDYGEAEGVDSDIENRIAIWRQEAAGDPFVQIGSAVLKDQRKVEANLVGFSRYALAY
jgi:hypothetical protein